MFRRPTQGTVLIQLSHMLSYPTACLVYHCRAPAESNLKLNLPYVAESFLISFRDATFDLI